MSAAGSQADLVVLAPDKNMEAAISSVLSRHKSLGIRRITFTIYVHPHRDPGCLRRCHDFLRAQSSAFRRALVVFDRDGCGNPAGAEQLEAEVEDRLAASGWQGRAAAVVIDPELEAWVWSDSPHVDQELRWAGTLPDLRTWLRQQGYWATGDRKPARPKHAMEAALRAKGVPRSSDIFRRLAERVSFERCRDPAFTRLRRILADWFPAGAGPGNDAVTNTDEPAGPSARA